MNVVINSEIPHNADEKNLVGNPFASDVLGARRPLKAVLQNEKVVFDLGTGPNLLQGEPLQPFEVALDYQDIEGREYSSRHIIDVLELDARPAGEPSITRIWRELEKIAKRI